MKKFTSTRLIAIMYMMVMGFAQAWAQDSYVAPPIITPESQEYNGTIMPTIKADEGCSIVYVKSTTKTYTTPDQIDANKGVKTEDSNIATITDIVGKTGNRYISAYAVKDVNGKKYKSTVVTATYTYNPLANVKTDITLSANSITLDMAKPNETAKLNITAKKADDTVVSDLSIKDFRFDITPEGIVTIDANGVVTPKAAGTASITIIFEGNDTYNAATCVADVNVASKATSTDKVFYSIADIRHATQPGDDVVWDKNTRSKTIKNTKCALIFTKENPATVIAVMQKDDEKIQDFANTFFIVDNSNRSLWITTNDYINPIQDKLQVGTKITGTFLGTYNEGTSGIPAFSEMTNANKTLTINGTTYTRSFQIDHSEEGTADMPATYPYTEITDVNTIANKGHEYGDIQRTSYGVYLNSIVKVPGIIRKQSNGEYYLVLNEQAPYDDDNKANRIYFNSSQIDVNLDDYVGTSGVFEGILVKRNDSESKLIVLKPDFFQINKIYLDENDDERRIDDLVNADAFDDEVDIYVHRTKLVNSDHNAWGTLCFPFDLSADEFKTAFGCELTALAAPKISGDDETINNRLTKHGEVDTNGNLIFTPLSSNNLNITEGMPYLMKATGSQKACAKTNITYKKADGSIKTPQELIKEDENYYAHIGQKLITVVPPHQIKGYLNNNVVNGDFYFRGLYGGKQYAEDENGNLTSTLIADNGSQKYQFISTATGNYLKYLSAKSTSKFPGFRAYFYFPSWNAIENNKLHPSNNTTNSKVHLFIEASTTGISDIRSNESPLEGRIYNLAGQVVDESYKGIVIKNGRKYLAK